MNFAKLSQTLDEFLDKYEDLKNLSEQELLQKGDYQAYEPKKKSQAVNDRVKRDQKAKGRKKLDEMSEEELHRLMIGEDDELLDINLDMRDLSLSASPKRKKATRLTKQKAAKDSPQSSSVDGDDQNLALLKELEMQGDSDKEDRKLEDEKKQRLARLNMMVGKAGSEGFSLKEK